MKSVLNLGTLALGVSLLCAMPVYAYAEEQESEGETTVESNPNDRICRRVRVTGTNIPQRICMSRAEWTQMREETREDLRESVQNDNANTSTVGSQ